MSSTAQIGYDTVLTMTASNKQPTQVYVPYVKATCMWRRAPLLLHIRLARGGPGLPWPATHDGLTWSTCLTQHIVVHGSCAELTPTTRFDHGLLPWLPRPCEWQTALTTQMALLSVQELCLVPGLSMMGSSCGLPAAAQCACPLAHLARIHWMSPCVHGSTQGRTGLSTLMDLGAHARVVSTPGLGFGIPARKLPPEQYLGCPHATNHVLTHCVPTRLAHL